MSVDLQRKISELEKEVAALRKHAAVLSADRQLFRSLFAHSPDAIVILDTEDRVIEVNAAFTTLFDYSSEEAAGAQINDLVVPPDYLDDASEVSGKVIGSGILEERESVRCTRGGERREVAIIGYPIRIENLNVGAFAIYRDIRGRKEAERALRTSEGRVRAKLTAILRPEGDIGRLDLADLIDTAAIQSLMDDFHNLTSLPVSFIDLQGRVLVGTGWQDICLCFHRIHPVSLKNCIECDTLLAEGVAPGTCRTYQCRNSLWDVVTPITVGGVHVGNLFTGQFFFDDTPPDRELFRRQAARYGYDEAAYLEALDRVPVFSRERIERAMSFYMRLAALLSDLGFSNIKLARTLVERDSLLGSLRERTAFLDTLIDAIPVPVYYKDTDGRYLGCNRSFEELLGQGRETIIGKTVGDLLPTSLAGDFEARDSELFARPGTQVFEAPVKTRAGALREVQFHKSTFAGADGQVGGLIGVLLDLTEVRRAEEDRRKLTLELAQAQKMESVGRLAGGIAHDFNNMLGVILGHAELALERLPPGDPLGEDLGEVHRAARRSADLTSQLLAYARKQTVAPKVLDLNRTVNGMLSMLKRIIGEDIDLVWNQGVGLGAVSIDPSQLDQVMVNLCVNARDAIEGVGKITIETGRAVFDADSCAGRSGYLPGDYVLLAVSDNGCGMDKETLDQVFEPFFTTKAAGQGTGLGLASVYGIVRQNRGFIHVYSEPGQGTTFRIYLPRHAETLPAEQAAPPAPAVAQGSGTVLLVEDEPMLLDLCRAMLERLGYTVLAAGTPTEALSQAETHGGGIDLLMTDVIMPEMNGRDLAGRLLALNPGLRALFMSGYTANAIVHHGVLDDGVCFLQKPFTLKDLADRVREALERHP